MGRRLLEGVVERVLVELTKMTERVSGDIVKDVSVEPEFGFSLAGVSGGIDLVEHGPVDQLCPEVFVVGPGDVGHGVNSELAIGLLLRFMNESKYVIV